MVWTGGIEHDPIIGVIIVNPRLHETGQIKDDRAVSLVGDKQGKGGAAREITARTCPGRIPGGVGFCPGTGNPVYKRDLVGLYIVFV